jgi:hypothetical protein
LKEAALSICVCYECAIRSDARGAVLGEMLEWKMCTHRE